MKIGVIGTHYSIKLLKDYFNNINSDCELEYIAYNNFLNIHEIINKRHHDFNGIFFSGEIGYSIFESMENKPNIPVALPILEPQQQYLSLISILAESSHIPFERIYFDGIGLFKVINFEQYNNFPKNFMDKIITFYSENLNEFTHKNILNDIAEKYSNNQIDYVILLSSNLVDGLVDLGIPYSIFPYFPRKAAIKGLYNLIDKIKIHASRSSKIHTGKIELFNKSDLNNALSLIDEYSCINTNSIQNIHIENYIITFTLSSKLTAENMGKYNCSFFGYLKENYNKDFFFSLGIGKTLIESNYNAAIALQYSKDFGRGNGFIYTNEKEIIGPINSMYTMSLSEYKLEYLHEKSKKLGIKKINLYRVLNIFNKKRVISSEDISNYLNITVRSSNRIISSLLDSNIIIEQKNIPQTKKGRPLKYYSLIKQIL